MLYALACATLLTGILGTIAAVARDVPILEAFGMRKTPAGKWAALVVGGVGIAAIALHFWSGVRVFGVEPVAVAWPLVLAYYWWTIAWRLRHVTAALLLAILAASPAHAWNSLGHKVIADIAWQQLDAPMRKLIVDTLRRHPKFAEHFTNKRTETVADEDRWIFQHAATWADQVRRQRDFDHPTWHYVNFPVFIGPERPVTFNREEQPRGDLKTWNVMQAVAACRKVIASDAPPSQKALAYCWLFHLVGDLHQPLHCVAMVCDRFPSGDRGGNSVIVRQGGNLHALWDNLLGSQSRMQDVAREVAELKQHPEWWNVDTKGDVRAWIDESRELAESFTYCAEIRAAIQQQGEIASIELPESYLRDAGERARCRVVVAGMRLAALLREAHQ